MDEKKNSVSVSTSCDANLFSKFQNTTTKMVVKVEGENNTKQPAELEAIFVMLHFISMCLCKW